MVTNSTLFLAGIMGSGKSSIGKIIASDLGWTFLDTDLIIESKTGKSIPKIFEEEGETGFRNHETEVIQSLGTVNRGIISLGGGALERPENREAIRKIGTLVWLNVEPRIASKRLAKSLNRPLISDAHSVAEIGNRLDSLLNKRKKNYQTADVVVKPGKKSPQAIAQAIIEQVGLSVDTETPWEISVVSESSYPVYIDHGVIAKVPALLRKNQLSPHAVLITDTRVASLYRGQVQNALTEAGFTVHLRRISPGEQSKSLGVLSELYDFYVEQGLDRRSPVVALGGGVVGDLAGFFAATYLRGIPLVHIPTSLLAQVDSSIGGKVGINLTAGKNLVGAFYNPIAVCMDVNTLNSLPDREWQTGLGEIIKYSLIGNEQIYQIVQGGIEQVRQNILSIVRWSVQQKLDIVSRDLREGNVRRFLNFGHTLGHALEKVTRYQVLNHGEAVYWGIAAALYLSFHTHHLAKPKYQDALSILERMHFILPEFDIDPEQIKAAVSYDKKRIRDTIHWVLLEDIGKPVIETEVREQLILDAIHFAQEFTHSTSDARKE